MNKRDIEKQLFNENSNIKVPEMSLKVKNSPLNKLLSGETPVQAFRKNFANMLLIFTAIIFIIVTLALAAFILAPQESTEIVSNSYVSLTVTSRDKTEEVRYGFVIDTNGNVIIAEKEYEKNGPLKMTKVNVVNNDIEETIKSLLAPALGDDVKISTLNASTKVAYNLQKNAISAVETAYGTISYTRNQRINDADAIEYLVALINDKKEGTVTVSDGIGDIIGCYLSICG